MGRLDALLEAWARWLDEPSRQALGGGRSLLARWMDAKGHLVFGGGGPDGVPMDSAEARIELLVRELGRERPSCEDALRLECAAGWWIVVRRHGLRGYRPEGLDQLQNALRLGINLRTYQRRLAEARRHVANAMGVEP